MKKYYTLIEVERELAMPIEELIQHAAHDELTISAIAQGWSGSTTNGLADIILEGLVDLGSSDLLQSLGADHTTVRKVKEHNSDGFVTLDAPVIMQRGLHLVTADELNRFGVEYCGIETEREWADPPYMDPTYSIQSDELQIAIRAWTALYIDGGYKPKGLGHTTQIEAWLSKHYPDPRLTKSARERIAMVVNPNKKGGKPKTKKDKPTA
jgi:hypothetical protein